MPTSNDTPKGKSAATTKAPARASKARTTGQKPAEGRGTARFEPASEEAVTFGKALAAARAVAGYSQKQVAQLLGRSQAAIATWEHGVYVPLPQDIFRVEQLFGLPAGSLSQHLGFLPTSGSGRSTPAEVTGAIMKDARLNDRDKQLILDMYKNLARG